MTPRELEKLLGGYAAGSLSEEERGALLRASLEDQQLFDVLADEEAMRDALADPVFRGRMRALLRAGEEPGWTEAVAARRVAARPAYRSERPREEEHKEEKARRSWWFGWPVAAMAAAAGAVVLVLTLGPWRDGREKPLAQMARVEPPQAEKAPEPEAAKEAPAKRVASEGRASRPKVAEAGPAAEAGAGRPREEKAAEFSAPATAAAPAAPAPPPAPAERPAPMMKAASNEMARDARAGIEVELERERGGGFEPVRPEELVEGDRVRLAVRSARAGVIEARWTPDAGRERVERAAVAAGARVVIPAAGAFEPGIEGATVHVRLTAPPAATAKRSRAQEAAGQDALAGARKDAEAAEAGALELRLRFRR
jgi:hypothetical protein